MSDKDECVFLAKLAEQAERYEEMVKHMKKVAEFTPELNTEERNLLSVAYKNIIGTRRASWRIMCTIENKDSEQTKVEIAKNMRMKIEKELKEICEDLLQLLQDKLVQQTTTQENRESQVFYMKMKGDYRRYIAEFSHGEERKEQAEASLLAYKEATENSIPLEPTNPIRLGLFLNFSVFYYEILNSAGRACELAKNAFDEAIAELDTLAEDSYKDSTLIMQLLRDNLTLWTSEAQQLNEAQGKSQNQLQDVEDEDIGD